MRTIIVIAAALMAALSASADPSLADALELLRITEPRDAKLARWTAGGRPVGVRRGRLRSTGDGGAPGTERRAGDHYDIPQDAGSFSQWVVVVSKTKHRGFYDLLVREKKTKKTERWRWNGKAYAK